MYTLQEMKFQMEEIQENLYITNTGASIRRFTKKFEQLFVKNCFKYCFDDTKILTYISLKYI